MPNNIQPTNNGSIWYCSYTGVGDIQTMFKIEYPGVLLDNVPDLTDMTAFCTDSRDEISTYVLENNLNLNGHSIP